MQNDTFSSLFKVGQWATLKNKKVGQWVRSTDGAAGGTYRLVSGFTCACGGAGPGSGTRRWGAAWKLTWRWWGWFLKKSKRELYYSLSFYYLTTLTFILFANTRHSFHPIVEIPKLPLKIKSIALPAHAGGISWATNLDCSGTCVMYALYSIVVGAIWSKRVKKILALVCVLETLCQLNKNGEVSTSKY